jgi:mRNA interferase RelE/StbE
MQPKRAEYIQAVIADYAKAPDRQDNNITALLGIDGGVRIRVGDWRVSMLVSENAIEVFEIPPRGSAYK